jgi:TP901 family phage tail tape measure protein
MTDRTVKVTLIAQATGYISGMAKAEAATRATRSEAEKLAAKKESFDVLGRAAIGFGTAVVVGVGYALKTFADFDAKMAQLQSLSHASVGEMNLLRDSALQTGQAYGFTASQVAEAQIELVKAGVSTKDILGGALNGALTAAAAGQIDVAESTEIATIALTQFKLKGQDIPHVADLLAAGADKALGSVGDLGMALKQSGLVAAQFGLSIDDTVGTLSAFANAGLIGSDSGTSFKQMLLSLAAPSSQARNQMNSLGIAAYDAQGNFVGITNLAGQLHDKLQNIPKAQRDAALSIIFGTDAIRAANVLYNEGSDGIQGWIDKVNDTGFAAKQAAGKLDSLEGDVQKLGAAFQTNLIQAGSGANDSLRVLVETATNLVTAIGSIPAPVQSAGLAIGGVVGGIALFGGAALLAVPKIAQLKLAMKELELSGKSLALKMGKGAGLALVVSSLVSGFANMGSQSELAADQLAQVDAVMDRLSKKNLTNLFKSSGVGDSDWATVKQADDLKQSLNQLASGNFFENSAAGYKFLDGMTLGITHLSDVYKTNAAQFKELGVQLANNTNFGQATSNFAKIADSAGGGKEAIRQLLTVMPEYKARLIALAEQNGKTLTTTELYNLAIGKGPLAHKLAAEAAAQDSKAVSSFKGVADDASGSISALADQVRGFGSGALNARDATRQFQQSVDDQVSTLQEQQEAYKTAHGTLKGFVATLDEGTQAGRDNEAALDAIAKGALNNAAALLEQTGSQEQANGAISAGRQALIDALAQFGITGSAAEQYANQLGLIPTTITTTASFDPSKADAQIDMFLGRHQGHVITFNTSTQGVVGKINANGGFYDYSKAKAFASGGIATGIYAGRPGAIYKFAEPETKWESFISGKPSEHARNVGIWEQTGARLGMQAAPLAYAGSPALTPAVSLDGMRIQGTLDLGNGLSGFVDGRIAAADAGLASTIANGKKTVR